MISDKNESCLQIYFSSNSELFSLEGCRSVTLPLLLHHTEGHFPAPSSTSCEKGRSGGKRKVSLALHCPAPRILLLLLPPLKINVFLSLPILKDKSHLKRQISDKNSFLCKYTFPSTTISPEGCWSVTFPLLTCPHNSTLSQLF